MAQLFENLPVTAANAPGTAVDVSALGAAKTVVVQGNGSGLYEPYVQIEVSNDAGPTPTNWTPVYRFLRPGTKDLVVACRFMRATVQNYKQGGAPVVNVGANDAGASFAALSPPAGNGNGAGVDVSSLPTFKTVQVSGTFKGAVNIEVSNDGGTTYSQADGLSFQTKGAIKSVVLAAEFMRVNRTGIIAGQSPGTPVVIIGASEIAGGGSDAIVVGEGLLGAGTEGSPLQLAQLFSAVADEAVAADTLVTVCTIGLSGRTLAIGDTVRFACALAQTGTEGASDGSIYVYVDETPIARVDVLREVSAANALTHYVEGTMTFSEVGATGAAGYGGAGYSRSLNGAGVIGAAGSNSVDTDEANEISLRVDSNDAAISYTVLAASLELLSLVAMP